MRCLIRLIGAALILAASTSSALAQQREQEPNDTCSGAQPVALAELRGSLDAGASTPTDVDFFRFSAAPRQLFSLTYRRDLLVGLFDAQCNLLELGDSNVAPFNFRAPADGGFVLGVAELADSAFAGGGAAPTGVYRLALQPQPASIGSISGRIVDSVTAEPLAGDRTPFARVVLQRCRGELCSFVSRQDTDALGQFRFEVGTIGRPIPLGDFQIVASASEYQSTTTPSFAVGDDEDRDIGDVGVLPPPVRFSDVRPCDPVPAQGGVCEYTVRIANTRTESVSGIAVSFVRDLHLRSLFEAGTTRSGTTVRRARIEIPPRSERTVRFAFALPSFVPNGMVYCVDLQFGADPVALQRPLRSQELFCVEKGASGLRVLDKP